MWKDEVETSRGLPNPRAARRLKPALGPTECQAGHWNAIVQPEPRRARMTLVWKFWPVDGRFLRGFGANPLPLRVLPENNPNCWFSVSARGSTGAALG
jgi:hypothetical protein